MGRQCRPRANLPPRSNPVTPRTTPGQVQTGEAQRLELASHSRCCARRGGGLFLRGKVARGLHWCPTLWRQSRGTWASTPSTFVWGVDGPGLDKSPALWPSNQGTWALPLLLLLGAFLAGAIACIPPFGIKPGDLGRTPLHFVGGVNCPGH